MYLSIVKRLLLIDVTDTSKNELLSTIIELVLAKVKSLCNIDKCNPILDDYDFALLVSQIVADIYASYKPQSQDTSTDDPKPGGNIKAVTIGDYKVEYATSTTSISYTTASLADSITFHLDKYDEELANYRYVKFY